MRIPKINFLIFFLLVTLFYNNSKSQIVFKELPLYQIKSNDSLFFDLSSKRSILPLNGSWDVYPSNDKDEKVSVSVPSVFQGKADLIFDKSFTLNESQINSHNIKIYFLGLNYTADISVNNVIIYRHSGGEFPFNFVIPRDILHKDKNNILSVRLIYELDSENTIPVKQRFLFPKNYGGIFRDVYLHLIPNISISDLNISRTLNFAGNRVNIKIDARIENKEFQKSVDTISSSNNFSLRAIAVSPEGNTVGSTSIDFTLPKNKERNISREIDISSPVVWSPAAPALHSIRLELWRGDELLDITKSELAIFSLTIAKDSLLLNGSEFILNGVTYVPSFYEYGSLATYDQMEKDIRIIKETGFNSIRFHKSVPHPYYLLLCENYGLLAFIEIPVSSVPGQLAMDPNFLIRSKNYLTNFIKGYKRFSSIAGIGFGDSFVPQLDKHNEFLLDLSSIVKKDINVLTYASFTDLNISPIDNLDLYGIEFFNQSIIEKEDELKSLQNKIGKGRLFISSATYVVNRGNSDGYLNVGSYEAQAKYFEELLDYSNANQLAGYFINTIFDYRGDFSSLISGYNEENIYHIGIAGEDRSTNRLAYKVITAKLHNTEKVTIPIGSSKDDAPMMYIIFGLVLALFMGVLVNSGRKFREDSSRALLRPYNFFADVRDMRIMSGPHTTLLLIVISAVSALIASNLLSYLKENVFFEKLLLSFGSQGLMKFFSYLSWQPLFSLIWLTIVFAALLILITIIVKISSFFVRNRVYLTSVYFTVVWSFLPLVLLIPLGIILYRILNADAANLYIFFGLIIFAAWIFYRLMKGIYVIFDVNAGSVYFYSILLTFFAVGGFIFYYELNNSVIDYIQLTFKQFNPIG